MNGNPFLSCPLAVPEIHLQNLNIYNIHRLFLKDLLYTIIKNEKRNKGLKGSKDSKSYANT